MGFIVVCCLISQYGLPTLPTVNLSMTSPPDTRPIIFVKGMGGYGNNLFQWASAYTIARKNNMRLHMSNNIQKLVAVFPGIGRTISEYTDTAPDDMIKETEAGYAIYNETFVDAPEGRNYSVCCYLQSWRYWRDYKEDILKFLVFNSGLSSYAKQVVDLVRNNHVK